MADAQIGNIHGVTDKSDTAGDQTGYNDADLQTIATMRSRLAAINGTYYTAARLNEMTFNDMVYAIRLNDNAGTI